MVILTLIQQMPRRKKGNVCMYVCVCLLAWLSVSLFTCTFFFNSIIVTQQQEQTEVK
jgi:hypothetical protein